MVTIQARADLPGERLAATSPLALDVAAVTRGQETYTSYCLACHGPGGDGDGPLAASLPRPPADLTSAHGAAHSDEDLLFWVENGIRGTSMPAFGDTLTPDQTRDVIAYVRAMQEGAIALRDAPDPAECAIAPRDLASLSNLAATPSAAR
ncbi:MAG: cytochrome c, partial [Chloroflexota bacterium]|nr:cytochrome c [Chloroflexota bacterium]